MVNSHQPMPILIFVNVGNYCGPLKLGAISFFSAEGFRAYDPGRIAISVNVLLAWRDRQGRELLEGVRKALPHRVPADDGGFANWMYGRDVGRVHPDWVHCRLVVAGQGG